MVGLPTCARTQVVTIAGADAAVNAIALTPTLSVTVALSKSSLRLKLGPHDKLEPVKLEATATIKNIGQQTVGAVTAQLPLYSAVGGAKVAKIPIKRLKGPTPSGGRDLQPGQSMKVNMGWRSPADGTYDIEILAVGGLAGVGRIAGVGSARLTVGATVLIVTSELGRRVRSAGAPHLIRAGTVFTVRLKLHNISYSHNLGIYPMRPDLEGNASDGHVETAGLPIQNPSLKRPAAAESGLRAAASHLAGGGDHRAYDRHLRRRAVPRAARRGEHERSCTSRRPGSPTSVRTRRSRERSRRGRSGSAERSGMRSESTTGTFCDPPPESNYAASTAYFAVGVFEGVWNLTGGVAQAVFKDLPLLLAKGIIRVPSAVLAYAKLEAELWDSIKHDPAKVGLFLTGVGNVALLAYKNAPAMAGNLQEFLKRIDQQVLAHYTRLANDESSGNYYAAVQEYGNERTEITGNLVLASGLLTRLPGALTALNEIKQASYVRVGETLNAMADGVGGRGGPGGPQAGGARL